jgi:hypothetical protein
MAKPSVSERFESKSPLQASTPQSQAVLRQRRLRYFKRADSWCNRFVKLLLGVHEGLWLGYLSIDELNAITAEHYGRSNESASQEHNMRGLFDWELRAVNRYFPPGSHVLVAAAGGGREVLALRRAGYTAEGFECNPALMEAGNAMLKELGMPRCITLSPPDRVPPGLNMYGGVVVGWCAYTHVPTRARRVEFLSALRGRISPGSPVLLSFFTRGGDSRYDAVVYRMATLTRSVVRARREPIELGDHLNWSYSRWFTRAEIEAELREAGMRLVHFGEVGDGHAVGIVE